MDHNFFDLRIRFKSTKHIVVGVNLFIFNAFLDDNQ